MRIAFLVGTAISFVCVVLGTGTARATQPPVLNTSSGDLGFAPSVTGTPQKAAFAATDRATTLDGGLLVQPAFDWALAADATAVDLAGSRMLGPVDLVTGQLRYHELQLALPALAPWPIGISYTGDSSAPGFQGNGWVQSAQPWLEFDNRGNSDPSDDLVYLIYGGDAYAQFKRVSETASEFVGINGAAGVIQRAVGADSYELYTYFDPVGTKTVFFGFDSSVPSKYHGQIWKYSVGTGAGTSTAYVGDSASPATAIANGYTSDVRISTAYDSAGRRFSFTYGSSGGASGRLLSVACEIYDGTTWKAIADVIYTYYGQTPSATTFGAAGSLSGVTVQTWMAGVIEQTRSNSFYYEAAAGGQPERLKMVLGYEGRRRSTTAFPSSWTDVTNDLKPRAQVMAEYTGGKVSSLRLAGMTGTQVGTERPQPDGEYTITYDAVSGGSLTAPAKRAVVKFPAIERLIGTTTSTGSAYATHYFNDAGEALATVTHDDAPTASGVHNWITGVVRDSDGRLKAIHTPANCTSYVHNTGGSPAGTYSFNATSGLVTYFERFTGSTDPLQGFVSGVRRGAGATGTTPYANYDYLSSWDYETGSLTIGAATLVRPLVEKSRVYFNATTTRTTTTHTDDNETTFKSYFHTGSLVRSSVGTSNPIVPAAQNGSGVATASIQYFDQAGQRRFTVVENGRVSYFEYDVGSGSTNTGLLMKEVADANVGDTSVSAAISALGISISNVTIGGETTPYHRTTTYTRDVLGRVMTSTDPAGRDTATFYTRLADKRSVRLDVPVATGTGTSRKYFGPVSFTVANHLGLVEESGLIQPSSSQATFTSALQSTPRGGLFYSAYNDAPSGWVSTSSGSSLLAALSTTGGRAVVSLSTASMSSDGSRPLESRKYIQIPGTLPGTAFTDYDRSLLVYNALGQVINVIDFTDTMQQVKVDALGRGIGVWKGIYNPSSSTPFDWLAQPGSAPSSIRLSGTEYDGGAGNVGNGLITRSMVYPNGDGSGAPSPRVTRYGFDAYDRVVATVGPEAPYASWKLDNLGRPLTLGMFDVDTSFNFSTGSFPDPAPVSWPAHEVARQDFAWDNQGRVYRDSVWGVDATDPVSPAVDPPMETDHVYGKMGKEVATVGATSTKSQYNRMCELKTNIVCSDGRTPSSSTNTYASAAGGPQSDETYTLQFLNVIDTKSGRTIATATAERPTAGAVCSGPLINYTMGSAGPSSSGATVGIAYDPTTGLVSMSTPNGPVQFQTYRPREDDQPWQVTNWGDMHERAASTWQFCSNFSACSSSDPTPITLPHMVTELEHDSRGAVNVVANGEVTGTALSGFMATTSTTFNAAGQPTARVKTSAKPGNFPSSFPAEACCETESESYYWSRGRLLDMGLAIPTKPDCDQHTAWGYPDFVPKYPPAAGWDNEPQYDNNQPLWSTRPGPKPIGSWLSLPPNFDKAWRRNPLGEVEEYLDGHLFEAPWLDPSGGTRSVRIGRDAAGRPTEMSYPQPVPRNGTEIYTRTEYDPATGLPRSVTRGKRPNGGGTETPLDSMEFKRGKWGLKELVQKPMLQCGESAPVWVQQFDNELPYSGGSWEGCATCQGTSPGWRAPYQKSRTLPGGINLNYEFDDYSTTTPPALTEPGIDRRMHRPTGMSFDTGSSSTPLQQYASLGLARPHYRSMPGAGMESYAWSPNGQWPNTNGPLMSLANADWRGRPRDMAWTVMGTAPGSGGVSSAAYAVFGYQLQWQDGNVTQARDYVRSPYWSAVSTENPLKTPWTASFDGPGFHESTQGGCRNEPLIWTRSLDPHGTTTDSASATHGPLDAAMRASYNNSWGNSSSSNPYTSPGLHETEMWQRDCRGTPTKWSDQRDATFDFSHPGNGLYAPEVFNDETACESDQPSKRDTWINNVQEGGTPQTPAYDGSGNTTDDGYRFRYHYDAMNRLTEVYARTYDSGGTPVDGAPVARYGYNALGWKTWADYDSDQDGDMDQDDLREYYQYDEQWRLTGIYRVHPPTPGEGSDPDADCPNGAPCLYQVYGYHPNLPVAMALPDTPAVRWRDTDCDGILDERLDVLSDAFGHVRGLVKPSNESGVSGLVLERYDYTPYGRPLPQPLGDVNGDGTVDSADLDALYTAKDAYIDDADRYDPRADLDRDGDVDDKDLSLWTTARMGGELDGYTAGKDQLGYGDGISDGVGLDLRIGYRGYQWDPRIKMYHVRHRVYDSVSSKWLTPDPIGHGGGDSNFYRYVRDQPWAMYDPMGLMTDREAARWGKVLGGAAEVVLGVVVVTTVGWTGIGGVAGIVLIAHGLDTMVTGAQQIITDSDDHRTYTSIGATLLARGAGLECDDARTVGEIVDFLVPVVAGFFAGAAMPPIPILGGGAAGSGALAGAGVIVVASPVATGAIAAGIMAVKGAVGHSGDGSVRFKRWKRGEPIDKPMPDGSAPDWDTVRERYWKNRYEASKNTGEFSADNLARMRRGSAPLDYNPRTGKWESRELHHPDPQRNGGSNGPGNVRELTPDQHRQQDPYRR